MTNITQNLKNIMLAKVSNDIMLDELAISVMELDARGVKIAELLANILYKLEVLEKIAVAESVPLLIDNIRMILTETGAMHSSVSFSERLLEIKNRVDEHLNIK